MRSSGRSLMADKRVRDGIITSAGWCMPVPTYRVAMEGFVCPECAAGKHENCDGSAWDTHQDEPTTCSCPCDTNREATNG